MTLGFVLPTLLGVGLVTLMGQVQWNLRPQIAIPLLTAAMAIATSAVTLVVASTAAAFALGPARATRLTDWCRTIPLHHEVDPLLGIPASALTVVLAFRCGRTLLARHRAIRSAESSGRISVIDTDKLFAYAIPTRDGCVVVSRGLLAPLTASERRAVFAHERAHLRLGHHRYLLATELSRNVLPFLAPLARQIQHATERAADEAAVVAVQDRAVVARAIATVAMRPNDLSHSLPGLDGGSVTRRVEALLWPHREPLATQLMLSTALIGGVIAIGSVAVQLHHFGSLLNHLCHGIS